LDILRFTTRLRSFQRGQRAYVKLLQRLGEEDAGALRERRG
jgi:hypothetical protein